MGTQPSLRETIWERDRGVCGLCGEPINNIKGMDVDHIIPFRRGGSHDLQNLRAAHIHCNRQRQAMRDEDYKPSGYKIGVMIYVEQDLLDEIEAVAKTNRSAWIVEAIRQQLARERTDATDRTEEGKPVRVQYFERARFEWHPGEAPADYDVMLTRLGANQLATDEKAGIVKKAAA